MSKRLITIATAFSLASILLSGCWYNQSTPGSNNHSQESSQHQKTIIGSYKDSTDGAAITLNADGTGRYVYADPTDPDTDDQLTWKKNSNGDYTITLQDSNVTSPLTGKLSGNRLILTGDKNWNTETFQRSNEKLDLNQFLKDAHQEKGNKSSEQSTSKEEHTGRINNVHEAIDAVNAKYNPNGDINWTYMAGDDDSEMAQDDDGTPCYWIRGQDSNYKQGSAGSYDGHDFFVYPDGTIKPRD